MAWSKGSFRRLQCEPVGLDHRVGEQFFAHLSNTALGFFLGEAFQGNLHILAEMHILHLRVAEIVEGMVNRLALGVEHPVF